MINKRILIVGGAGSIGSELVRQLAPKNKIFILDIDETRTFDLVEETKPHWVHYRVGDVRNKETVQDVFSDFKPQIIFHAGAYKHVTPMELYPEEAVNTNILGTLNLIKAAKNLECVEKFTFISTDKAVSPSSIMGATKLVGEIMARNAGYTVVRFGNVLGSRGSLIPIWEKQLASTGKITVTDPNVQRYFMSIQEAVELVIKATVSSPGGETYILDMGQPVKILELAKEITDRLGRGKIEVVGLRPGERLNEELMTHEEKSRAVKKDQFFIIS